MSDTQYYYLRVFRTMFGVSGTEFLEVALIVGFSSTQSGGWFEFTFVAACSDSTLSAHLQLAVGGIATGNQSCITK